MNANADLEHLQRLWQADADQLDPAELRRRVTRETRRKQLMLLLPIVITIAAGGWVAARTLSSRTLGDAILALETGLLVTVTWGIALWIDRGTWRPIGDSTRAFVDLSIRRCQSALTTIRVSVPLYLIQLAAVMTWKVYADATEPASLLRSWPVILLGWVGVPTMLVFSAWYARRKTRELERLVRLREQCLRD